MLPRTTRFSFARTRSLPTRNSAVPTARSWRARVFTPVRMQHQAHEVHSRWRPTRSRRNPTRHRANNPDLDSQLDHSIVDENITFDAMTTSRSIPQNRWLHSRCFADLYSTRDVRTCADGLRVVNELIMNTSDPYIMLRRTLEQAFLQLVRHLDSAVECEVRHADAVRIAVFASTHDCWTSRLATALVSVTSQGSAFAGWELADKLESDCGYVGDTAHSVALLRIALRAKTPQAALPHVRRRLARKNRSLDQSLTSKILIAATRQSQALSLELFELFVEHGLVDELLPKAVVLANAARDLGRPELEHDVYGRLRNDAEALTSSLVHESAQIKAPDRGAWVIERFETLVAARPEFASDSASVGLAVSLSKLGDIESSLHIVKLLLSHGALLDSQQWRDVLLPPMESGSPLDAAYALVLARRNSVIVPNVIAERVMSVARVAKLDEELLAELDRLNPPRPEAASRRHD